MRIKFNSLLYKTNRFHVAVRLSVIDHRRRQNVVRTSVTIASCATFLFLPHFDVICDLLLNRHTATWNLFLKYIYIYIYTECRMPITLAECSIASEARAMYTSKHKWTTFRNRQICFVGPCPTLQDLTMIIISTWWFVLLLMRVIVNCILQCLIAISLEGICLHEDSHLLVLIVC